MTKPGKFIGIGVGPGDPELLTLKAIDILKHAAVIAVPYSTPKQQSLALQTARDYIKPQTRILKLHFPMVKDEAVRQEHRLQAAEQIAEHLRSGEDVAFLTEGDPMLYSTFAYLLWHLEERFPIEIVPGISSVMASAAQAHLPLATGDQRLAVLPANYENIDKLGAILALFDTVVLMKVHAVLEELIDYLAEKDLLAQAVLVERASAENCRVFTDLQSIERDQVSYLSQLIVSKNIFT